MSKRAGKGAGDVVKDDGQDKQKRLLAGPSVGRFSLIRAMHLADLITLINGLCGFLSIVSCIRYTSNPSTTSPLWGSLVLMPLGLVADFMDGKVARWRGKSSLMGQELDSLADLISFGVAPAICAYTIGMNTFLDTLALAFFVLCGLTRLARFNVTVNDIPKDKTGKSAYFEGTPIPTSLSIVGLMAFWVYNGWIGSEVPVGVVNLLGQQPALLRWTGYAWMDVHPVVGLFVLWGFTMTSRTIHIPKP